MQNRMKEHPLDIGDISALLRRAPVGALATVGADGTPYNVPVHFAPDGEEGCTLYVHGLPAGEKLENIKRDPAVCLTAWEMDGLILPEDGSPCNVNTAYRSVVAKGTAKLVEDLTQKERGLRAIIEKYTPDLAKNPIPEPMLKGTAVIEITITEGTGKYYK